MATRVDPIVRDYFARLARLADPAVLAEEFEQLSAAFTGNSRGWKFNREELHDRR